MRTISNRFLSPRFGQDVSTCTFEEMLEKTDLNFNPIKEPMVLVKEKDVEEKDYRKRQISVNDHYAIVRSDNNKTLGIVGKVYEPIPHIEILADVYEVMKERGMSFYRAGSIRGGKRLFVSANYGKGNDGTSDIDNHIYFMTGNDGLFQFRMALMPTRAICMNQMVGRKSTLTIAHKGRKNLTDLIRKKMEVVDDKIKEFYSDILVMREKRLSEEVMRQMTINTFKLKFEDAKQSSKSEEFLEKFAITYQQAEGQEDLDDSAYKWYNAVTYVTSHQIYYNDKRNGGDKESVIAESSLYEKAAKIAGNAFSLALSV